MTRDVRILGIDPGITTGLCAVENIGNTTRVLAIHAHPFSTLHVLKSFIESQLYQWSIDTVIVELPPRQISHTLSLIFDTCSAVARGFVGPGEWKPVAGHVKLPFSPSTQHEKDAYRMVRYWLFKMYKVPLDG